MTGRSRSTLPRRPQRRLLFALAAALLFVLSGCGTGESVPLAAWTLYLPSSQQGVQLALPARIDDRLPGEPCVYRLVARVLVPESFRGRGAVVSIPFFRGVTELRADGRDMVALERDLVHGYRARGPHSWAIPAELTAGGIVTLELVVHHEWQQSAWLDTVPRLTTSDAREPRLRTTLVLADVTTYVALGTLAAISFASLVLFMLERRHKGYAWLALATASVSEFVLFDAGVTERLGARLEVPISGVAVATAILAVVSMTHANFGLPPPPPRVWWLLWGANAAACALGSNPFASSLIVGRASLTVIIGAIAYLLVLHARLHRGPVPAPTAAANFFALLAFVVCVLPAASLWLGLPTVFTGFQTTPVGLVAYVMVQFYGLARVHSLAVRVSEGRQQEIVVLNQELRRQVAERSERLFEALARLGAGANQQDALAAQTVIDGRYRVVRELGAGAMGTAYEVRRLSDDRTFAIKVLSTSSDARIMARFAQEAHIAAKVNHPNLVSIVDMNFAASGFMYLVMEYVHGASLERYGERYGDLGWALEILRGTAAGLVALHAAGVVHRDLKPANVLVAGDGDQPQVKIADFGISSMLGGARAVAPRAGSDDSCGRTRPDTWIRRSQAPGSSPLTEMGEVIGTPNYMAPEAVFREASLSTASDVFSFGVLAFELLTGTRPFVMAPAVALLRGEVPAPARHLWDVRPDAPAALARLIHEAMSLSPELRPTAAELAHQLSSHAAAGTRLATSSPPRAAR